MLGVGAAAARMHGLFSLELAPPPAGGCDAPAWLLTRYSLDQLFEELGLYYIGPVDGHNVDDLVAVLNGEAAVMGLG